MSLARVKTWIPGDVLTAADLNAEFNNVLNNPISLISPSTGAINFALQAHTNLIPSALSASSGSTGQALVVSTAGATIWGSVYPAFVSATSGSTGNVLTVSTSGAAVWAASGASVSGVAKNTIIFTATSTTYSATTTAVGSIKVQLWGPGGGGGAANGGTNSGGGGGAGGYAERIYAVTTSWGAVSITLPVGGLGGTVSASSGKAAADGAALFTSTANPLTANSGGGGGFASTKGSGGTASGGTINITGFDGSAGDSASGLPGVNGGNAVLGIGQGGYGRDGGLNGSTGKGYSAGGGAGSVTGGTGGAGAPAVCIVTEFS